MAHALLSPSSAHRWTQCPGSVVLSKDLPDESSEFADEGTAAHYLAAAVLKAPLQDASGLIGTLIWVNLKEFVVDDEMAAEVQKYVDLVRSFGGELMVEQSLPISHITSEDDAHGTADAVVLLDDELIVVDLKYGRGVKVDAVDNKQLAIYVHAALNRYDILGGINQVRMVISQPRLNHVSEWSLSIEELQTFINRIAFRAGVVRNALTYAEAHDGEVNPADLNPGESQCRWCQGKATCPALAQHVMDIVADDFLDISQPIEPQLEAVGLRKLDNDVLGDLMAATDLIEDWIKAVRAKVEAELFAGNAVPGFKLVEGRRGSRKWIDEKEAETLMKSMRLKLEEMYDLSLISPTTAEKLSKNGVVGPRQWPKLQALITQKDGKPSVAPESDKRPALVLASVAEEFDDITDEFADML